MVCADLQVRLNESQSKNKLYFGNLPRSYTQKQLEDELKSVCKGVLGIGRPVCAAGFVMQQVGHSVPEARCCAEGSLCSMSCLFPRRACVPGPEGVVHLSYSHVQSDMLIEYRPRFSQHCGSLVCSLGGVALPCGVLQVWSSWS